MYSTCIFCQHSLGANETFTTFPVGKRLAYDAEKGRLWVVCPHCARWNLTPLDERWETIEEAERRFHDTRLRAGSGEIALAKLREGTELVRIGRPSGLELASWRYGDVFNRRRKQHAIVAGSVVAGGALALGGALSAGMGVVMAWQLGRLLYVATQQGAPWSVVARLRDADGNIVRVRPYHLRRTTIDMTKDEQLRLTIDTDQERHWYERKSDPHHFIGEDAQRVLSQLLPSVNRMGGSRDEIAHALDRLEHARSVDRFFVDLARRGRKLTPVRPASSFRDRLFSFDLSPEELGLGLFALPRSLSLAMEMAANEDRERRAIEGDLSLLEAAWREAEEIAKIADALLVPPEVQERLDRLKSDP